MQTMDFGVEIRFIPNFFCLYLHPRYILYI